LKENQNLFRTEPGADTMPPESFLELDEVLEILGDLKPQTVLLEGQEASLDPQYAALTNALHQNFGSRNILCTNAFRLPPLDDTDELQISIKAFNEELHNEYTGEPNAEVLKNVALLYRNGKKLTISSVFIPGYIDVEETGRIARFLATIDRDIPYHILAYFKAGHNPWRRPAPFEMAKAASEARKYLNKAYAWTGDEKMEYEVIRVF
jgi:pyruvate formate lyase activating enzyme